MESTARRKGLTDEERQLWDTWRRDRQPADRLRLYEHYAPWMRQLAGHYARGHQPLAEWGDYLHLAAEGLLQAIDRYEPRDGARFQAYAEHYIRGAISKGLACYRKDSRPRDRERVAHHLPLPSDPDDAVETLMDAAVDLAFGYFLEAGVVDEALAERQDPYALHQQQQHVDFLALYVERLPERERQLIRLHYFEQVGLAEIATLLGVSRPRVTQLHGQALRRIKGWFAEIERAAPG